MKGTEAGFAFLLGAIIGISVATTIAIDNVKEDVEELKQTFFKAETETKTGE